jgi:cobalt-zinc-cadmium efflux system protein
MMSDAVVSLGVIVAGGLILLTGWLWIDPITSLILNLVIVLGTWGLLRDSFAMSVQGVPRTIEPAAVRDDLVGRPGVSAIHDLHVWPMSTTTVAMTCHLTMPGGHPGDAFLHDVATDLRRRFRIDHVTLQVETSHGAACPQAAGHMTPALERHAHA